MGFIWPCQSKAENSKRQITDDNVYTLTRHHGPCCVRAEKHGGSDCVSIPSGVGLWGARIKVLIFQGILVVYLLSTTWIRAPPGLGEHIESRKEGGYLNKAKQTIHLGDGWDQKKSRGPTAAILLRSNI